MKSTKKLFLAIGFTLVTLLVFTNIYATEDIPLPTTLTEEDCKCTHNSKEYSQGSEVCMDGVKKECAIDASNNCYWADLSGDCN